VIGNQERLAGRYPADTRSATCRRLVICVAGALTLALMAIQVAAVPPGSGGVRHPLKPRTVWDSVFSLAQAGRGESTYRVTCASCHGDSLSGINDAPPLAGPAFLKTWNGNALSSLFNRISNDMPSDNPGTLSMPQAAELAAFVLRYNGFPAGAADLPAMAESLSQIRFAPKR
jgi:mono/diheme cytochrome c family protein